MKTVNILESQAYAGRFYTGVTDDIQNRVIEHNDGKSLHTAKFRPWVLRAAISFADESKAHAFERYLKTGSGRTFTKRHF